jgi:hypothetical protein
MTSEMIETRRERNQFIKFRFFIAGLCVQGGRVCGWLLLLLLRAIYGLINGHVSFVFFFLLLLYGRRRKVFSTAVICQ